VLGKEQLGLKSYEGKSLDIQKGVKQDEK